jgi:hypothetical protein
MYQHHQTLRFARFLPSGDPQLSYGALQRLQTPLGGGGNLEVKESSLSSMSCESSEDMHSNDAWSAGLGEGRSRHKKTEYAIGSRFCDIVNTVGH